VTSVKTPRDLGRAGRALFASVVAEFELNAAEVELLLAAARTADAVAALDAVVAADGTMTRTAEGDQPRVHPAVIEARLQRLALGRLVAALRLPQDEDEAAGRPQRRGGSRGFYAVPPSRRGAS
jgi:hypothetical protein